MACPSFARAFIRSTLGQPLLDAMHEDKLLDVIKRTPSMWVSHCTADVLAQAIETENMPLILALSYPCSNGQFLLHFPGLLDLVLRKREVQTLRNLAVSKCNQLDMCTPEILRISVEESLGIASSLSLEEKNWDALYSFPDLVRTAMEVSEKPMRLLINDADGFFYEDTAMWQAYKMLGRICPLLPADFEELGVHRLRALSYNLKNLVQMCTPAVIAKAVESGDARLLENLAHDSKNRSALVAAPGVLDLALGDARLLYCLASQIECTPAIIRAAFEMRNDGLPALYVFSARYSSMICTLSDVYFSINRARKSNNVYVSELAKKTINRIALKM